MFSSLSLFLVPCSSSLLFSTCTYNCLLPVAAAATLLQLGRPFTSAPRKSRNKLKSNLFKPLTSTCFCTFCQNSSRDGTEQYLTLETGNSWDFVLTVGGVVRVCNPKFLLLSFSSSFERGGGTKSQIDRYFIRMTLTCCNICLLRTPSSFSFLLLLCKLYIFVYQTSQLLSFFSSYT